MGLVRPSRYATRNVYTRSSGQNMDATRRNDFTYGQQNCFSPRGFYDNRRNFPVRQGNYSQRFPTRYDIPYNTNYGRGTRDVFNGRPRTMTYYQNNPRNSGMLALPSTQNTLNYELNRSRNNSSRVNNISQFGTGYYNSGNSYRNDHGAIGPCRICDQYGHLQSQCGNLNSGTMVMTDRHNSDTRAVLNYVNTVGNDICVHYYNDMTMMAKGLDCGCNKSNIN